MAPPRGAQTAVRPPDPGDPRSNSVSNPNSPNYNPNSPQYDSTRDPSSRNYIDRGQTADTGQEVRDRAEQQVTAEDEATDGGFLGLQDLIEWFTRNGRVSDRASGELSDQAAQLAAGVKTREAPPIDAMNYQSFAHKDLDAMVKQGVDPGAVGTTGDQWISTGEAMVQFQTEVAQAINNSESDWQGSAANKARGFMASVGNWVGSAGEGAALAGTQMNVQSQSLSTAGRTMPEEVPWNPQEWLQKITESKDPWGTFEEAKAQYNAHQEAKTRAAQVVTTYDNNLAGSGTMPAFTAPPTMSSGGGGKDPGKGGDDGVNLPGDGSTGPGGSGSGSGGSGSGGGGGGTYTPPQLPGGGNGPNGPGGPGGLPPGGTNPGGTPGVPGGPGGPGFPGGGPGGPGSGGIPPGGFPIGGGPFGGGPGGDSARSGRGPGGGFGPGGGRGFGPGGGSGGGLGSGSGSGSESGSGTRGGVGAKPGGMGAGALAADHAAGAGRGGLGAGGRGGAAGGMPMGGMGGARGQGDEDGEHQRPSYLVEADPDSLFGTDELTAPPVIGE